MFNSNIIECKESYKYLGIELANNGKMAKAKLDLSKRAQKAIFKMKTMFKTHQYPSIP